MERPEPHKALVVHSYGAHQPYRERYVAATAPFAVDGKSIPPGSLPTRSSIHEWWDDYDDAVDESFRFLAAVVARAEREPGEVFIVFTPDHGENLLDDSRGLTGHALKAPTWWDTHVPMIVWANEAWRNRHADRWAALQGNRAAAVMHMDVAATLLGAAGIDYTKHAAAAADLGAGPLGARARTAGVRPGLAWPERKLLDEAGLGGLTAP
jgi:glucan phosphoethanolaminetransferase (alkaline phosphatase superfamily)